MDAREFLSKLIENDDELLFAKSKVSQLISERHHLWDSVLKDGAMDDEDWGKVIGEHTYVVHNGRLIKIVFDVDDFTVPQIYHLSDHHSLVYLGEVSHVVD